METSGSRNVPRPNLTIKTPKVETVSEFFVHTRLVVGTQVQTLKKSSFSLFVYLPGFLPLFIV